MRSVGIQQAVDWPHMRFHQLHMRGPWHESSSRTISRCHHNARPSNCDTQASAFSSLSMLHQEGKTNLSHDGLNPAHVPCWRVNNPTLALSCGQKLGRADIEGSKSNVAVNAWLPQASYPCGNFSDTSDFRHSEPQSSQRIARPHFHVANLY